MNTVQDDRSFCQACKTDSSNAKPLRKQENIPDRGDTVLNKTALHLVKAEL